MQTTAVKNTPNYLQKILLENFLILKGKNSGYSLRAYARKLGISPAALSEMMSGKRGITLKTARKLFDRLNISPLEKDKINKFFRGKKSLSVQQSEFLKIEMDQYHIISDWYYFAILSLAETEDFHDNPSWIAKRLNIRVSEVKIALERMERLNLLKRNDDGHLVSTGNSFKTSSDISNAALRKSHSDNLNLAQDSLDRDDVEVRDISSMTMAIDPDLLPEAKKMIQEFRRKLTQFLESEKKQEVYKLNIQLFPLSVKEGAK